MPTAEYMRTYRKRVYRERRDAAIAALGGACVKCGVTTNLEIDHIDASKKTFEIGVKIWCMSAEKLEVELNKCQLLCESCHAEKTIIDVGNKPARGTHGSLSAWRYCKCDICRAAYNAYNRDYKRKHRAPNAYQRPRTGLIHGTRNGYCYYKCRCEGCRKAQTDYMIKNRAELAKRSTAPHS